METVISSLPSYYCHIYLHPYIHIHEQKELELAGAVACDSTSHTRQDSQQQHIYRPSPSFSINSLDESDNTATLSFNDKDVLDPTISSTKCHYPKTTTGTHNDDCILYPSPSRSLKSTSMSLWFVHIHTHTHTYKLFIHLTIVGIAMKKPSENKVFQLVIVMVLYANSVSQRKWY